MSAVPTRERDQKISAFYTSRVAAGHEEQGVVKLLAAIHRLTRPSIYKVLRRTGTLPPYGTARERRGMPAINGGFPFALPPTVNRDPCPRCGVRADIGCRHGSTGPLSMMLFA